MMLGHLGRSSNLIRISWGAQEQQTRGMATLKAISMRLKSVKNIKKITQSMKMVSAAKYAKAERELKPARPYGVGASSFYEKADVQPMEEKPNKLIVAMSSDRGLCGGIHSAICKHIRAQLQSDSSNTGIVCVGDKSKLILMRHFPDKILFQVNEVGRKSATFEDAAAIASEIINSGYDFGSGKLIYNRFKSVVAYQTLEIPIFSLESVNNAPKIGVYDSIDADVLQSYMEYSLASLIFYTLKEGACSEQSARMTAMESATKNAGEMIDKLTLTFNRTRQAVITGELIEIISGAAAI